MSKPRKIELSIPSPCSEDWDKMSPEGKDRFCASCSTIITDFSAFTDKELIAFLSKAKDAICGRFDDTQLNRVIAIQETNTTTLFHKIIVGAALATGVAGVAHAQTTRNSTLTGNVNQSNRVSERSYRPSDGLPPTDTLHTISGIVKDGSDGDGIMNASIIVYCDNKQDTILHTDINGHYSYNVPLPLRNKKLTFSVYASEYKKTTTEIETVNLPVVSNFNIIQHLPRKTMGKMKVVDRR